jgi:hypothetical protein
MVEEVEMVGMGLVELAAELDCLRVDLEVETVVVAVMV